MSHATESHEQSTRDSRIALLEAELMATRGELAAAEKTIASLRRAYANALEQLQLLRHKLFVAKAERVEAVSEQLAFDSMLERVQTLAKEIETLDPNGKPNKGDEPEEKKKRAGGRGRRKLDESALPVERLEILDPTLEQTSERIGFEDSWRIAHKRGYTFRLLLARAVYKVVEPVLGASARDGGEDEGAAPPVGAAESTSLNTGDDVPGPAATLAPPDEGDTGQGSCLASHGRRHPSEEPTASSEETESQHAAHPGPDAASEEGSCAAPAQAVAESGEAPVATAPSHCEGASRARTPATASHVRFVTAPMPKELVRRGLLAPSMIAYILAGKYLLGVPFYRLEQQMALVGAPLDRGTMCRYAEHIGATLGAIVEAMRKEAFETAFCLSTDATGICIQPGPMHERKEPKRQACRKGHFFVVLADRDHVFFEYQEKHTSAAVCEMFRGFSRYIQADAHAIYDALFRGSAPKGAPELVPSGPPPIEVGCWSHGRRNFWDAAVCKHSLGLEGLRRIDLIFDAERQLKDLPPATRKRRRDATVRPLVDAFFAWAKEEHARPRERGLVTTALGYVIHQEQALRRFLEHGRLRMTNNLSESALRAIAAARKLWMFFGSDDHASAAANIFSLVASCKLHGLDPETYLEEVIRVMPCWPRQRYLELSPRYWSRTRARLDPQELGRPLGHVSVPPPLPAEQQGPPG